uniref:REST corepressor 3 n=2 Tax=Cacopsylla melanoneura TaxID=428564 RepID=A0A8D8WPI1_9HEMI
MWKPHHSINSDNVHSFIQKAKNQYNYREDQALGLLFHHQYNFTTASAELSKYYMLKKNWSKADKDKFDKLIAKYRKNFDQIQVNMPHKTMREIIAYYYERKVALKKFNRLTKNKKAKPAKSFLVRRTHNRRTSPQ